MFHIEIGNGFILDRVLSEFGLLDEVFIILLEICHVQGLAFAHYAIIFITADASLCLISARIEAEKEKGIGVEWLCIFGVCVLL